MDAMKRKVQYFFEGEFKVHVRTQSGFYNGFIIKIIRDEYFIIDDRKFGETPVYFSELIKIFKSGLEIHQQLDSKEKLFCKCPCILRKDDPDFEIKRNLHAVAGESGEIDIAAQYQTKFNVTKQINEFKEEVIKASKILDKIKEIKWQD